MVGRRRRSYRGVGTAAAVAFASVGAAIAAGVVPALIDPTWLELTHSRNTPQSLGGQRGGHHIRTGRTDLSSWGVARGAPNQPALRLFRIDDVRGAALFEHSGSIPAPSAIIGASNLTILGSFNCRF